MSQALPIPPPGFKELSIDEQVEYIEALLDFMASQPDRIKIPRWHWEILSERLSNYQSVEDGITWEEFEKELDKELMS